MAFTSQAQLVSKAMTSTVNGSVDSVRANGVTTNYLYIAPLRSYTAGSFQAVITRVSASLTGNGRILLQGSLDGTTYYNASTNVGDTITITNAASQSRSIRLRASDGFSYRYYRLAITGGSGDTATVRGTFVGR